MGKQFWVVAAITGEVEKMRHLNDKLYNPSHLYRLQHLQQAIVRGLSIERQEDVAHVGLEGRRGLRAHQALVDVLVESHHALQVLLELADALFVFAEDLLLGPHQSLQLAQLRSV